MRKLFAAVIMLALLGGFAACRKESKVKDRGAAHDMFEHIVGLTESYITKVNAAKDSAAWAAVCTEFEDSLDRVVFTYPADTDLLLSEGQNDTIVSLMQTYVKTRDRRIRSILHPVVPADTTDTVTKTPSYGK